MKSLCLFLGLLFIVKVDAQEITNSLADFDFYIGNWSVENRKHSDDGTWVEFPATVEVRKILNGKGNIDFFKAVIDGQPYEGITLRQFDEAQNQWQIRWYDSEDPTAQPEPSIGRFENGEGKFYKTIPTDSGGSVMVRFYWHHIQQDSFKWEAAWSGDNETWNPVWIMNFKRRDD